MTGWRTRAETPEDSDFVTALFIEVRGAEFAALPLPPSAKQALLAQQSGFQIAHYRSGWPAADWRIVEQDGVPVGRTVVDRAGLPWSLLDISLVSGARGAGLGTAILTALQDEARCAGAPVRLYVEAASPARRLYARLGFAETGEVTGSRLAMMWTP